MVGSWDGRTWTIALSIPVQLSELQQYWTFSFACSPLEIVSVWPLSTILRAQSLPSTLTNLISNTDLSPGKPPLLRNYSFWEPRRRHRVSAPQPAKRSISLYYVVYSGNQATVQGPSGSEPRLCCSLLFPQRLAQYPAHKRCIDFKALPILMFLLSCSSFFLMVDSLQACSCQSTFIPG